MFEDFLAWYLAPWRRMGRKEFGIILTLATVPGIVIMLVGWGSGAGSVLEPILGFMGAGQQLGQTFNNAGDLANLQQGLERMQSGLTGLGSSAPAAPAVSHFDWGGLINALCLLACVPMCRMRLLDMGWVGWQSLTLLALINLATVGDLVHVVSGFDVLPAAWVFSMLNFCGYFWLMLAKSRVREAPYARIPAAGSPAEPPKPAKEASPYAEDDDKPTENSPWK
jgi:hypothetical protein